MGLGVRRAILEVQPSVRLDDRVDFGHREAVEAAGSGQGVGAHVFKDEPIADVHQRERSVGGDAVEAVAGGTPDGAAVVGSGTGLQEERSHLCVIVQHAIEAAVDAVVDVIKVAGDGLVVVAGQLTAAVDARGQSESRSDVVAARLGDNVDAAAVRKVAVQRVVDDGRDLVDGRAAVARVASSQIQDGHVVTVVTSGQVKQLTADDDAALKHLGLVAAGTHVEADADQIDAQLAGEGHEARSVFGESAKLDAQRALDLLGVAADAEHHLGGRMMLFDLVQLALVVERHGADVDAGSVSNVRHLLGRIGENDAVRLDAQLEHLGDLALCKTRQEEKEKEMSIGQSWAKRRCRVSRLRECVVFLLKNRRSTTSYLQCRVFIINTKRVCVLL